jgi:hypothetical protein
LISSTHESGGSEHESFLMAAFVYGYDTKKSEIPLEELRYA